MRATWFLLGLLLMPFVQAAELDARDTGGRDGVADDRAPPRYRVEEGRWKRAEPQGPAGAWQVALRYSTVDLTDGEIQGDEEHNLGVAFNWYPNYYLRSSANYIDVIDHERQGVSDEPGIFQLRAQVAF